MAGGGPDYRVLFDALPTPCLVLSADLTIIASNRAHAAATGRRGEEIIGQHLFEAFPDNPDSPEADGVANLQASLRRVLATGQPDRMAVQRYDIDFDDGRGYQQRFWRASNTPLLDERGDVVFILHVVDDITESVRTRRRLEAEEVRFRELVENASDAVVVVREDRSISYVSPTMERILGFDPDLLASVPWGDLPHEEDRAAAVELLHRALHVPTGQTVDAQLRVHTASGEPRWLHVQATNHLATPAIAGVVMNGRDVTAQRAAEQLLATHAMQDALTGLPNRRAFQAAAERALARAERTEHPTALLLLDVDHFKVVNDSLGHAAGDQLLVELTIRLSAALRPSDTLARLGGDEFVVLAEDLGDESDALTVAQRLATAATGSYQMTGTLRTRLGVSIGVATATSAADADELLAHADTALYEAKRRGRGRIEVFDPQLREQLVRRLHLAHELEGALERGELRLHWQPICTTGQRRIVAAEALVRWAHPDRGLLGPAEFLPVAEQSGFLPAICSWVITQAVRQAVSWQEALADPIGVSINIAAVQLADPELVEELVALADAHALDPGAVCLEVSEWTLNGDVPTAGQHLRQLREHGFRIALDDFGAGNTALSWLRELPLDLLKLDRRFTAALDEPETEAILGAIVQLAPALGIATLAEGVETDAQLATLARLGCDYVQGHRLARPVPAEELTARLERVAGPGVGGPG